ncbi:unnamed protein product [Amoebophrya sp. A120]|nr:unnamed protein product [Amoebophrya sp. A120]|eukprot:GSA120T00024916001.1
MASTSSASSLASSSFPTQDAAHKALSDELWRLYDSLRTWLDTKGIVESYFDILRTKIRRCTESAEACEAEKDRIPQIANQCDQVGKESGMAMQKVKAQLDRTREVLDDAELTIVKQFRKPKLKIPSGAEDKAEKQVQSA